MKRENTFTIRLNEAVTFDGHSVWIIKFDLGHINYGWNIEKHDYNEKLRSHYTSRDIVDFFEQFTYYQIEWEEGHNKFCVKMRGQQFWRYIAYVTDLKIMAQKKIVIDVPIRFKNEAIVVTIY